MMLIHFTNVFNCFCRKHCSRINVLCSPLMILGEDPKHVFQLDTILSLSLSLCLSPSVRLSLSLVLDLASILVSALVLVLVLVLALGLARRPEAASGSHLEANIGNTSFSLQKL